MGDIFVRYLEFPHSVRGVTIPNDDGTFSVYINARLSEASQREAYTHELAHIRMNHFYDCEPVIINEREAGSRLSAPAPPPQAVPKPVDPDPTIPAPPVTTAPGRQTAEARERQRQRDQATLLCREEKHLYHVG